MEGGEGGRDGGGTAGENTWLSYPRQVLFIFVSISLDRAALFFIKPIMVSFLMDYLHVNDHNARIIYHLYLTLFYLFPIYGAILADVAIGKFLTVFCNYLVGLLACILLMLAAVPRLYALGIGMYALGLVLFAMANGGIMVPSISLGADQFHLPQDAQRLMGYCSLLYFLTNAGAILCIFVGPLIRSKPCLGEESCYALIFGLHLVVMIISFTWFVVGKRWYILYKPEGNVLFDCVKCIRHALKERKRSEVKKDHWLDYAEDRFGGKMVNDVKTVLRCLLIFIPIPMFFALTEQQGSAWVFMARQMDGDFGVFHVLPEHTQIINPILLCFFIPLFDYVIYPMCARVNFMTKPLDRMIAGTVAAVITTAIAALVCFRIEKDLPSVATHQQVNLLYFNPNPCPINVEVRRHSNNKVVNRRIESMYYLLQRINRVHGHVDTTIKMTGDCISPVDEKYTFNEYENWAFYIAENNAPIKYPADLQRSEQSLPKIRFLSSGQWSVSGPTYELHGYNGLVYQTDSRVGEMLVLPYAGKYDFKCGDFQQHINVQMGGVYVGLLALNGTRVEKLNTVEVTKHNDLHILWLCPQYLALTIAEVLFSIPLSQFCYLEAPKRMNTLLYTAAKVSIAMGNVIIIIIELVPVFSNLSDNFLMYGALLLADTAMLIYTCHGYEYYTGNNEE